MTTLEDFEKGGEKERKKPSHPKRLALTPLGKMDLKKSVLEGRIKMVKKPTWWNEIEIPDTIPGCFGGYPQELKCKNCSLKVWCERQKNLINHERGIRPKEVR